MNSNSDSPKKSLIGSGRLYHKKARPKSEDEIGRRKEQIFVNAIAKQYTYVVEEETIEPEVGPEVEKMPEVLNQVETDDHGAGYRIHEGELIIFCWRP